MTFSSSIKFKRDVALAHKIVLVDGITRTGKSMLGPILSAFKGIEIERVEAIFEYIPMLYSTGHISKDAAMELLQLEADTKMYESFIGRNSNFRFADHSSVFNTSLKLEYLKRLFKKNIDNAPDQIKNQDLIFQVQTHDTLGMIDIYFDAFQSRVFILEMVRDPIDLIYSWYRRGWGHRFTSDPLALTFTVETDDGLAPWYETLLERHLSVMKPVDRIICMIEALQKRNLNKYLELQGWMKKQIVWILFEDFVTNPMRDIGRIEKLLGTAPTKRMVAQMRKEKCPRTLDKHVWEEKKMIIQREGTPEFLSKIDILYEHYSQIKEIIASE